MSTINIPFYFIVYIHCYYIILCLSLSLSFHIPWHILLLFIVNANPWAEQSSPGHLIFFLIPIGIQISINFILFILTAIHCSRIKAEIHRMQSCDNSDQQKRKIFLADKAMWVDFMSFFFMCTFRRLLLWNRKNNAWAWGYRKIKFIIKISIISRVQ